MSHSWTLMSALTTVSSAPLSMSNSTNFQQYLHCQVVIPFIHLVLNPLSSCHVGAVHLSPSRQPPHLNTSNLAEALTFHGCPVPHLQKQLSLALYHPNPNLLPLMTLVTFLLSLRIIQASTILNGLGKVSTSSPLIH